MSRLATRSRRTAAALVLLWAAVAGPSACGAAGGAAPAAQTAPSERPLETSAPDAADRPHSAEPDAATAAAGADRAGTATEAAEPKEAGTLGVPAGIVPARIEIPAIGVDATVVELDIRGTEPEVPDDFDQVGWYGLTRKPGEIGPAVLAGHIDSRQGPAVFHQLNQLVRGDRLTVHASDGATRTFEVMDTGQYPKVSLPDEVFGIGEGVPELRLITCGGSFDASAGHYRDNYVVYARQVT